MRRRNMYYATGLPGWMRFGYSPGWVGRSPNGLGPCAKYLTTGQWPTAAQSTAWSGMAPGVTPPAVGDSAVARLQAQAQMLQQQLEAIQEQLARLQEEQ
jgi:hypothetical protein